MGRTENRVLNGERNRKNHGIKCTWQGGELTDFTSSCFLDSHGYFRQVPDFFQTCTIKHKDDGLTRRKCIMQAHVYGAEFLVEKFFNALKETGSVPIWEPVDLTVVRTMSNGTLREDRE